MQKILIANHNVEQSQQFCQHLTNDEELEMINTLTGTNTVITYNKIKPNVLILDSTFDDMDYVEIIDRLSGNIEEKKNCNTILTISNPNKLTLGCNANVSKIYKVFFMPFNYEQISNTVHEICNYAKYKPLEDIDISTLFIALRIPLGSNGSTYLKEAILQCYYSPQLLQKLDDIFLLIGKIYDKPADAIRSSIRTSLRNLNIFRQDIQHPIMKYFDNSNITPKVFLKISSMYLHIEKNKK